MTIPEILAAVHEHGATLVLVDGHLLVKSSTPLPQEVSAAIRAQRGDLTARLRLYAPGHQSSQHTLLCPTCGTRLLAPGQPVYGQCAICAAAAWVLMHHHQRPYVVTDADIAAVAMSVRFAWPDDEEETNPPAVPATSVPLFRTCA